MPDTAEDVEEMLDTVLKNTEQIKASIGVLIMEVFKLGYEKGYGDRHLLRDKNA